MQKLFVPIGDLPAIMADLADGAVVATTGSGGGLLEPDEVLAAIEDVFLRTGRPRDLTLVHALGIGDKGRTGTNRFAHKGMVRRVIGGHWTWSPTMLEMARTGEIEAYCFPAGAIVHLLREIGAGRPGLITKVGLGTFVDPRHGGGKVNTNTREDIVELMQLDGQDYLRYKPFRVDLGVIRATYADEDGNLCALEEPADLDAFNVALAAHNSGGRVVAQVREIRPRGSFKPREVSVPGLLVDVVAVAPNQRQTYFGPYNLSLAGLSAEVAAVTPPDFSEPMRRIIAHRAADELVVGSSLNFGFGMSADVAALLVQSGRRDEFWTTVEQGLHNGTLMTGDLFGIASNPVAISPSSQQFDLYSGGGLDQTFLGMAEMDGAGNVNVHHVGGRMIGPGGFVDISQGAKTVVFCGTFTAKGLKVKAEDGQLQITTDGAISKLMRHVTAITFSGAEAVARGQRVIYVTERAVFELTREGVELIEIAPGIDLQTEVLARMDFAPIVRSPRLMRADLFTKTPAIAATTWKERRT